jgi:hypothetical protein
MIALQNKGQSLDSLAMGEKKEKQDSIFLLTQKDLSLKEKAKAWLKMTGKDKL